MVHDDPPDDVVAEMLKQDAKNASLRYARIGLGELLPKRPTAQAPKPNQRFLRNLLTETESHNKALRERLAREQREKEIEARALDRHSDRRRERRLRNKDEERVSRSRRDGDYSSRRHRRRSKSPSRSRSRSKDRHRKRRHRSRSRSRSPREDRSRRSHHRRRRGDSRSRSRSRDRDRKSKRNERHSRRSHGSFSSSPPASKRLSPFRKSRSPSSDPLEAIVGPLPPKRRGRGAFTESAALDRHFAADYDPAEDTLSNNTHMQAVNRPGFDGDQDWDDRLEEFRDRQKWKQQGAERLRQAGFTEEQIKKWEKSEKKYAGDELDADDVVWNKRGEGREWDRGKVLDEKGMFVQRPEWVKSKDD